MFNSINAALMSLHIFTMFLVPQDLMNNVEYEVRYNVCVYYIMYAKYITFYLVPNLRQVNI
jgi:hypothetical protein